MYAFFARIIGAWSQNDRLEGLKEIWLFATFWYKKMSIHNNPKRHFGSISEYEMLKASKISLFGSLGEVYSASRIKPFTKSESWCMLRVETTQNRVVVWKGL